MCFSAKLLMDCFLLLMLIVTVVAGDKGNGSMSNTESASTIAPKSTSDIPASSPRIIYKPNIVTLPSAVGRIKVKWDKANPCQGYINFSINFTRTVYLCDNKDIINSNLAIELCEERRCGEFLGFKFTGGRGYMIHENLTVTNDSPCKRISLICKDADMKELVAYKVVTGLLLTLIIAVLLCRFAQPAYIAIHKRFSQKQQNRWIGPTQSQSVSYHRGQANHPNNNTMKRQSYPGLERLSVNPSREPSSNRNSDYDSYGG